MIIKIGSMVLNSQGQKPQNLAIETKRVVQTEIAIAAENAKIFDRANISATIVFFIERIHSSDEECEEFMLSHSQEMAAFNGQELTFICETNSFTAHFESPVLSKMKIELDGIISRTRYEFSASTFNLS